VVEVEEMESLVWIGLRDAEMSCKVLSMSPSPSPSLTVVS